jgi:hypothetical protein
LQVWVKPEKMNQQPVGFNSSMEFGQVCWMTGNAQIEKLSKDVCQFHTSDKGHPVLMFAKAKSFKSVANQSTMPVWRDQFSVPMIEYLIDVLSPPGLLVGDWMCGAGSVSEAAWRRGRSVVAVDKLQQAIDLTYERLTMVAENARNAGDDYKAPTCPVNQLGALLPDWMSRDVAEDKKNLEGYQVYQARMTALQEKKKNKALEKKKKKDQASDKEQEKEEEEELARLLQASAEDVADDVDPVAPPPQPLAAPVPPPPAAIAVPDQPVDAVANAVSEEETEVTFPNNDEEELEEEDEEVDESIGTISL